MTQHPPDLAAAPALSFAGVADAYERARPGYPGDAAVWLAGKGTATVLELGAGTGKLTAGLTARGHRVVATDPLPSMLAHVRRTAPEALPALAVAERIPLPDRSVDLVVTAQAFHWFDVDRALPEIARVLRPGGQIALAWNERDERIPWVRRLGDLIHASRDDLHTDPTEQLLASDLFGQVEHATFRIWQSLDKPLLRDLVTSRSNIATMSEHDRAAVLARVDALYDEYGRGADGMRLPYVTSCYRATVLPREDDSGEPPTERRDGPDDDTGPLLIDFQ